jgi:hypothetical protein
MGRGWSSCSDGGQGVEGGGELPPLTAFAMQLQRFPMHQPSQRKI